MRKKVIVIVLVLSIMMTSFVVLPKPAMALISGDFGYSLIDNDTAAQITSYSGSGTVVTIPDSVDGYPVVSIGSYSLSFSHNLTQVIVPDGVTDIGYAAFYECNSLASVTLPDSLVTIEYGAFYDCSSLTTIDLPKNLTTLQGYAFFSCDLKSITIPASITSTGDSVFGNCYNLTSVSLSNGLTSIGSGEFSSCYNLTSISIPVSISSIGAGAFYDCRSLTYVYVPGNVTDIGNSAFQNCNALTAVDLGSGVTQIEYAAFYGCSALKSIIIPDSVGTLGYGAFYGCTDLISVTLGANVTSIGALTFYGCSLLTNVSVPDSVSIIGYGAFFGCLDLSSVTIGTGVTDIGGSAFGNCSSLISITFNGIAPSVVSDWIVNHDSDLLVHFRPGASGFTAPTWQGANTEMTGTTLAGPRVIGVKPGSGSVEISWNTLNGNGSEGIDYYIVYQDGVDVMHVASGATATITGLVDGRTYSFRIAAHDAAGAGLLSSSFDAVPYTSHDPLSVTITSPTESSFLRSGNVTVTWTVGGYDSNLSSSEIRVDDGQPVLLSTADLSYQIQGLRDGPHMVNVTLLNAQVELTFAKVIFNVDSTTPSVIEFSPQGNATSTRIAMVVRFSENMDQTTTSIVLEGIKGGIKGVISWNGSIATFVPSSTLIGNTTFQVLVNGQDRGGNPLPYTNWTFTTANVGTIAGRILDDHNIPVVNATVTLTRTSGLTGMEGLTSGPYSTSFTTNVTRTDAHGNYSFYDVAFGNYTLTATKDGYDQTSVGIGLNAQGIAAGGLTVEEKIFAQGAGGDTSSLILIIAFAAVIIILLAIMRSNKKK